MQSCTSTNLPSLPISAVRARTVFIVTYRLISAKSQGTKQFNSGLDSCPRRWYLWLHGQAKSTGSNRFLITPLLRCGPTQRLITGRRSERNHGGSHTAPPFAFSRARRACSFSIGTHQLAPVQQDVVRGGGRRNRRLACAQSPRRDACWLQKFAIFGVGLPSLFPSTTSKRE